MATTWFIQRNEKSVGLLSGQQLRELAVSGKLRGDDLVRKDDAVEFTPASRVKNLFADDTNNSRPVPPPPRLPSAESQWLSSTATTSELSSDATPLADSEVIRRAASDDLPSPVSSWLHRLLPYWTAGQRIDDLAAANKGKNLTPNRLLLCCLLIPVLIALLLPAVKSARDAARKAQAERQIEKSRDGSATAASSNNTLSSPTADSSASTLPTETGTFMQQLAKLQGVPANTPLPRREFDKHGGYFHSPRHYYRVFNQINYDKWVDAFGEPFGVRKAPYGEHEWQQTFQGQVVYLSGWLKTPIHDERIKNDKPMVILNAVSVD